MAGKAAVPVDIFEEYYQIGDSILSSFPKYRPPLDFYVFDEKVKQLLPFFTKGGRLTNDQVMEVARHCAEGNLFVSRSDHSIYILHIAKQLDLILLDKNLKETEIVDISLKALNDDLEEFFNQPVKAVFEKLEADVFVLTEYLWEDRFRLKGFLKKIWIGKQSLATHSLNTLFIGLFLLFESEKKNKKLTRKDFNQSTMALLMHDVGMTKMPVTICQKEKSLTPEDRSKIEQHVQVGYSLMHKLDQIYPFMEQGTLEHQERLDGSGYPQHAKELSFFGRLVAVADSFSAMIAKRPYAEAKPFMAAASELALSHSKFDREIAGLLLASVVTSTFGGVGE